MSTTAADIAKSYIDVERRDLLAPVPAYEELYLPKRVPIDVLLENIDSEIDTTATSGTSLAGFAMQGAPTTSDRHRSGVEEDLKKRAELFSRSYAEKTFTTEEETRFKILTEKAILTFPRVTKNDFEELEASKKKVQEIMDDISDLL